VPRSVKLIISAGTSASFQPRQVNVWSVSVLVRLSVNSIRPALQRSRISRIQEVRLTSRYWGSSYLLKGRLLVAKAANTRNAWKLALFFVAWLNNSKLIFCLTESGCGTGCETTRHRNAHFRAMAHQTQKARAGRPSYLGNASSPPKSQNKRDGNRRFRCCS